MKVWAVQIASAVVGIAMLNQEQLTWSKSGQRWVQGQASQCRT